MCERISKIMKISREVSNTINQILDNVVPPVLRDAKWFMAPLMRIAIGPKFKSYMEFKENLHAITDSEINEYYTLLADTFIDRDTDLSSKSVSFILDNLVGNNVVDIGCGRGYLVKQIFKSGRIKNVHGFDISMPEEREREREIQYQQGTILSLPYESGCFDTVICAHTLEHIRDINAALKELKRVAKKRLIIVVPKQRPYKYTFDLHIHFFPYLHDFKRAFHRPGEANAQYYQIQNDYICVMDFVKGNPGITWRDNRRTRHSF